MKKILLFLLLISSLFAEAKFYVGTTYGLYSESFSDIQAKSSSDMATFKIGYGDIKAFAVELSLDYSKNESKIFSSSTELATDGDKIGFNINLLKAFDLHYVYPYVKAGFGTGSFNIQRSLQDDLSYGTFQMALGTYVPISDSFDLEVGYEVRHTSYQSINTIVTATSYRSVSNMGYFGINYRY